MLCFLGTISMEQCRQFHWGMNHSQWMSSVAVSDEISRRSPRKLVIVINKEHSYRIKVSQKIMIQFWNKNTGNEPPVVPKFQAPNTASFNSGNEGGHIKEIEIPPGALARTIVGRGLYAVRWRTRTFVADVRRMFWIYAYASLKSVT